MKEAFEDLVGLFEGRRSASGWAGDPDTQFVEYWSEHYSMDQSSFLNQFGEVLAKGFISRKFDWEFADWAVNKLYWVSLVGPPVETAEKFDRIYLAFDDSETVVDSDSRARANLADLGYGP